MLIITKIYAFHHVIFSTVLDLLCRNSHEIFQIISSAYVVILERRILDKGLNVLDNSIILLYSA
jgi:ABC-type microcin C transport system permease subunit YejE